MAPASARNLEASQVKSQAPLRSCLHLQWSVVQVPAETRPQRKENFRSMASLANLLDHPASRVWGEIIGHCQNYGIVTNYIHISYIYHIYIHILYIYIIIIYIYTLTTQNRQNLRPPRKSAKKSVSATTNPTKEVTMAESEKAKIPPAPRPVLHRKSVDQHVY